MPRPNVSEQRRTRILAVARKMLARKPLRHIKMQDIATKAGLSVGGVYWYFKGKKEIVLSLLLQNSERNIILINRLIETNSPTSQRIQIIFERLIEQVSHLSELYLMGAKYHAMLSHVPETRMAVDQIYVGYRKGLTTLIEQGISCGEFRPVDARNAAITMIGTFEGLMLLWSTSAQFIHLLESCKVCGAFTTEGVGARIIGNCVVTGLDLVFACRIKGATWHVLIQGSE